MAFIFANAKFLEKVWAQPKKGQTQTAIPMQPAVLAGLGGLASFAKPIIIYYFWSTKKSI